MDNFTKYFFLFGEALSLTLQVTTLGITIGIVLGVVFGLMKLSRFRLLKFVTGLYINLIRGTPLLLQLFAMYWIVGKALGLSAVASAAIGLGIHNGAYIAEIVRGAVQSIDRGQTEAARSLGMSNFKAMRRIILPQALKRAIPPLGNQFIIALKDSSLASSITVMELMGRARIFIGTTFDPEAILAIVAIYYLALTNLMVLLLGRVEKRLARGGMH